MRILQADDVPCCAVARVRLIDRAESEWALAIPRRATWVSLAAGTTGKEKKNRKTAKQTDGPHSRMIGGDGQLASVVS